MQELPKLIRERDDLNAQVAKLRTELIEKRSFIEVSMLTGRDTTITAKEIRKLEANLEKVSAAVESAKNNVDEFINRQADAERITRIQSLREKEERTFEFVVANLVNLGKAIDSLAEVHRLLTMYGCAPQAGFSSNFIRIILHEIDRLNFTQPELLGIDPDPSQTEITRKNAEDEVERLKGLISARKNRDKNQMYPYILTEYERDLELALARKEKLSKD